MGKKEYVQKYIKCLDNALKGLFDETRENEIIEADKIALGDDYDQFEAAISAAYDKVAEARDILETYSNEL